MAGEAERPLSLRVREVTKGTLELPVQAESANHGRRLEDESIKGSLSAGV